MPNISNVALERRVAKIEEKMENQVAVDMALVYYKVDQLEKAMNERMDRLEEKMGTMDSKLDLIVNKLSQQ